MQNNLKISFDIHGVMDHLPDVFSFLSKIIVENGAELHVITGSPINVAEKELEKLNITYTHLFSIPDYHISIGTPSDGIHPKYNIPVIPDDLWDRTKGDYCLKHGINLHIDDTIQYNEHFKTPFCKLWTNHKKL